MLALLPGDHPFVEINFMIRQISAFNCSYKLQARGSIG